MALSKASIASSCLPSLLRAIPLLFQAAWSISMALSKLLLLLHASLAELE